MILNTLLDGDIYACVADVGWITGHSYIVNNNENHNSNHEQHLQVYGPLCNGATTLMFESTPVIITLIKFDYSPIDFLLITKLFLPFHTNDIVQLYPTASRYWQLVETHKVTQFYTAPTAIRAVQKFGLIRSNRIVFLMFALRRFVR